jgi:hypothetical protein
MQGEFLSKVLRGRFRLLQELLRSEKFQTAFGATSQGWRLADVLKEHQLDVNHDLAWHVHPRGARYTAARAERISWFNIQAARGRRRRLFSNIRLMVFGDAVPQPQ